MNSSPIKTGEDRSVTDFLIFLTSVAHSLADQKLLGWESAARLIKGACNELYISTQRIQPLLIKAYLSHLKENELEEKHFLQKAYEKSQIAFWSEFQCVYRFSKPLKDVSAQLNSLPPFGNFNDIKPGQNLFYYPDYTHGNPYQILLYEKLKKSGVELQGISNLNDLDSGKVAFNKGDVCHIHWINIVFKDLEEDQIEGGIDRFLKTVASLKSKGMKIYWTVHNRYSHDFPNQALEKSFRERLYQLVDKVFVHHPILLTHLKEWLPDCHKVEFIEHGNYIGHYPAEISLEKARMTLGLNTDDLVISVLGQIRPYKDLHKLLPTIGKAMQLNNKLKLVVAGKINCEKTLQELALLPETQVLIKNEFIDDDEIQKYIKAASFVLLSYRDILTSGSLFHAFSFGVPVIAPALGSIPAYVVDGWNGFLYKNPKEMGDILNDKGTMRSIATPSMEVNALRCANSLTWDQFNIM